MGALEEDRNSPETPTVLFDLDLSSKLIRLVNDGQPRTSTTANAKFQSRTAQLSGRRLDQAGARQRKLTLTIDVHDDLS